MKRLPALLLCWVTIAAAAVAAETNLARNGSFEADADADGSPDEWRISGDGRLVQQELTIGAGSDGRRCAKLACTRFAAGNPACHAMLCQMDVPIKRGKGYRLKFKAKGRDITAEMVSIAISDTKVWKNCGLEGAFAPTPEWRSYEFAFHAKCDGPEHNRLQIWFSSTGTLWLDDLSLVEASGNLYKAG